MSKRTWKITNNENHKRIGRCQHCGDYVLEHDVADMVAFTAPSGGIESGYLCESCLYRHEEMAGADDPLEGDYREGL